MSQVPVLLTPSRGGDSSTSMGSLLLSGSPFCEDIFPYVQAEPLLSQLEAISSHHVEIVQDRNHKDGSFRAFYSDELHGYLIFNSVNIVF